MTSYPFADGQVPFAPIPTDIVPMKFEPDSTYTVDRSPMAAMWQEAYRRAALQIEGHLFDGDLERAQALAQFGHDLESAYIVRESREAKARQTA